MWEELGKGRSRWGLEVGEELLTSLPEAVAWAGKSELSQKSEKPGMSIA